MFRNRKSHYCRTLLSVFRPKQRELIIFIQGESSFEKMIIHKKLSELAKWSKAIGPLPSNFRNLHIFWVRTRLLVVRKAHKNPILVVKKVFSNLFHFRFFLRFSCCPKIFSSYIEFAYIYFKMIKDLWFLILE